MRQYRCKTCGQEVCEHKKMIREKLESSVKVDCHAAHTARNDKKARFWKTLKMCFQKTPQDSRIFDEFCALREKAQGSYLEW